MSPDRAPVRNYIIALAVLFALGLGVRLVFIHQCRFAGDEAYLGQLDRHVPHICEGHRPELVLYVAGADPFEGDQLGELRLTKEGLRRRDELVLGTAKALGVPAVVVVAGGYARRTEDVVDIHCNTCRVVRELWG